MARTDKNHTRDRILRAADRLFGERGFDAVTTREIAEAAHVNKALIHYHFQSKEGLFLAVFDDYYQRLQKLLVAALGKKGSPRERAFAVIDSYVDFLAQNRGFSRLVQRESSGGPHVGRVREYLLPMFKLGIDVLTSAYPKTRKGDLAAHQLLITLYGMIVGYFSYGAVIEHLVNVDPFSEAELKKRKAHLRRMFDLVENELSGQGKGAT